MKNKPEISIITVNYNGASLTKKMIESIYEYLTIPFKIIVVDNGSKINEAEILKKEYPEIVAIRSERNLGFAGGNNLGIKHANGDYYLFLNNDTELKDDSVKYLVERLKSSPKIGGTSPKIKYYNAPDFIQYAGYTPLSKITLRNSTVGMGEKDDGNYDVARKTSYLHGAAFMLRGDIVKEIGPMPELFFLYYEEFDWCERIKEQGYELWYEPASVVYHKESMTVGSESDTKVYYMTRNRLIYAERNRKGIIYVLSIIYQIVIVYNKWTLIYLLRGKFSLIRSASRAVRDFLKSESNIIKLKN